MTRDELIAALERATGADRELDAAIWRHIGLTSSDEAHCVDWCGNGGRTDLTRDRYIAAWAPSFTASIDAAMTLVLDDYFWSITMRGCFRGGFDACCLPEGTHMEWHTAATPATALCIAALKARAE